MIEPFGSWIGEWRQVIVFLSVASMVLGAVAAIAQHNIKRLMAYSSIGHVGYALIGLAAGTAGRDPRRAGLSGDLSVHECRHLGGDPVHAPTRADARRKSSDLAGLSRTQPALALALAIFMFALAGIPPTAGFFAKLYIFLAAIDAKLIGLAVIGVVTSVVGAFYYLRIVKVMYFDEPAAAFDRPISAELKGVLSRDRDRDVVLLSAARTDRRQCRGGGCVAVSAMTRLPPRISAGLSANFAATRSAAPTTRRSGWRAPAREEGMLVWALEQTAGRGRRGRPWVSPPGNLYVSLILRPACPAGQAAQLGFVAALGGRGDALGELGPALGILCATNGRTTC